jgi:AcrR family transcriptional regulator
MPKVVDHDERRAALAEAVWRLASREGLEALTLRDVSAEASCSTGALHHYFRDKEELLLFAFQTIADRVGRRIDAAKGATSGPLDFARTLLAVGLPLDAERRDEIRVWFAFLGLALTRPVLAEAQRDAYRAWRGLLAQTLKEAQERGEIDRALDPELEAAGLVALVDGLAVQASFEPRALNGARQMALVDERLAGLAR